MPPSPLIPLRPSACWLPDGATAYTRLIEAIGLARASVRFEFYIFAPDATGARFRTALVAAARRGVRVEVLVDGFGSAGLPASYWDGLLAAGGRVRVFNPISWRLFSLRNHRKLVLVDDAVAFVGGFNIGDEYDGDGVTRGWRDLGLEVRSPLVIRPLAAAFDGLFQVAGRAERLVTRLRRLFARRYRRTRVGPVFLIGPGLGRNRFRAELLRRLRRARHVQLVAGYFLPSFRLRRALRRVARRGGRVEILLAGRSDVPLVQRAARAGYGPLLRAGVRIWEYEPQILHAKLALVDHAVYVGSANLDTRSAGINYEVMVRCTDAALAAAGRLAFAADLARSREITLPAWRAGQTWFTRFRGMCARFLLTRIDPWLARAQLRSFS
ncbi:MAG: phosphatidylserine/phosphatidylglycerophosphate/cardiolipin synthase family protein [Verrucomicrobia bacterium]|nr:phosphatidylserine/phosphatidylglycerophosphate/cardiolipin synthase family protein [Verrucomicrobiota bacterium]